MSELDTRLEALKAEAKKLGYTETLNFKTDRGEDAQAAVCWGIDQGAPTARVLLIALPDGTLQDTAEDDLLALAYQAPTEEASEPVAALTDAGGGVRYFDLDPFAPHEIDKVPPPEQVSNLKRLGREPTFEWSIRVYADLQEGFDSFHERVYSSVRDTVDGKNDIIDEVAKFIFLELFRIQHKDESLFDFKGQQLSLDEVFSPEAFEKKGKKELILAVEKVKAAFETFKGHKDYITTSDEGDEIPIFPEDVHLKLSVPQNYASLIGLLQNLRPLTDNYGRPYTGKLGVQGRGCLADVAGDVLGRVFDVFLRHKFEKEGVGIYLTPKPVKQAMVEIALHDIEKYDFATLVEQDAEGRPVFRVGDPAAGSLGFLVTLIQPLKRMIFDNLSGRSDEEREAIWRGILEHSFIAADSSPRMVRLGRLNMALQEAPRAKVYNTPTSLLSPLLKPCTFDLILANPPFGTPKVKKKSKKKEDIEERERVAELMEHFRSDIDFEASNSKGKGILTPSPEGLAMGAKPDNRGLWALKDSGVDLSVLFLDRCLQLLKPGGRLLMVVPDSLLCNANTRYVREYLIGKKDDQSGEFKGGKAIVKAVISLPSDTFKLSGTGAKTSILYVQKRKSDPTNPERFLDEPQTDVFMTVADTLGYAVKGNQEVYTDGDRFIPNDLVPIVGAYKRGE